MSLERIEWQQAKHAAEDALRAIDAADAKLRNAKGWGIFDMIGGGLISSLIKRSRIQETNALLGDVERSLAVLSKELKDVSYTSPTGASESFGAMMLDIAFDNIFTDIFVQSELNQIGRQLSQLREDVQAVDDRLAEELAKQI